MSPSISSSSAPTVDPAILRALFLSSSSPNPKITSHGTSGFTSTFRLTIPSSISTPPSTSQSTSTPTSRPTSNSTSLFLKTAPNPTSSTMFAGEHASLNAIHSVVPSLCPRSLAHGKLDNTADTYFLLTEFLDFSPHFTSTSSLSSSSVKTNLTLAQKLAKLHTTPAPIPERHNHSNNTPPFGFPVPTYCGSTPQNNTFTPSWSEFFAQRRLLAILDHGEQANGPDSQLRDLVERTATHVVPRLLGDGHLGGTAGIKPVVVHGDLWSGNRGRGVFAGRGEESAMVVEEVVFDPSSCYAHSEYELGIMRMFGGFGGAFMEEYHALVPRTEPVEEYEDRVKLYESYHHLNHWAIFGGGGYRGGAVKILSALCRKYGAGR